MIQVMLRCTFCERSVSMPHAVGHSTPHWARKLWRQALAEGWARDEQTMRPYCDLCRATLGSPSERERPLAGLPFAVGLYCDDCGTPGPMHPIQIDRYGSRQLRNEAQQQGWNYCVIQQAPDQKVTYGDYCSACKPPLRSTRWEEMARLVWTQPTVQAAAALGISDVALGKQCRRLGVPKPPPGFWRKYEVGQFRECRALIPPRVQALLGSELDQMYPVTE